MIKKINKSVSLQGSKRANYIDHLQKECQVLKEIGLLSCYLPKVFDERWTPGHDVPFIPLVPVGIPLPTYSTVKPRGARTRMVPQLIKNLEEGLNAAREGRQYCHSDLRPDNVIFDMKSGNFVIIDWGLARKVGEKMHLHTGGLLFFHDDIVEAAPHADRLDFIAEYDMKSVKYIAYMFENQSLPWDEIPQTEIIVARNNAMQTFTFVPS